jgi:hypothetical protein
MPNALRLIFGRRLSVFVCKIEFPASVETLRFAIAFRPVLKRSVSVEWIMVVLSADVNQSEREADYS